MLSFVIPEWAQAQTPGLIFQPATGNGRNVLDPNLDNYVSKANTGYAGTTDIGAAANEIAYRLLPQLGSEPLNDLVTGSGGGHTDLAPNPLYMAFNGTQVLFRVRLGGNSSASKGYSFLIDSDGVFNKQQLSNGTLIDYSTPSKVKNLGFEYEVVLALNFDVVVYRHRGSGNDSDPFTSNVIWRGSANGGYSQYFQKAIAASTAGGNTDYFFDFYVPLSAFRGDGGIGISPDTPLRVTGSTVTSAQTGLEGTISDVGGIDDRTYANDKFAIWRNLIPVFPSTSLNQIQAGEFCQTAAPAAPVITTSPAIRVGTTTITGTSTENGGTITLFRNGSQVVAASPVIVANGAFSFPLPSGTTLAAGDILTVRVTRAASGNCAASTSVSSNSVTVTNVVRGECTAIAPSELSLSNGSKSLDIITNYSGLTTQTLKVYRDGNLMSGTVVAKTTGGTTYTFTPSTTTNQFAFAYDNTQATSYGTLTASVLQNGCESPRSASYYLNGNSLSTTPNTNTTATPTITSTPICTNNSTLTGTAEPNSLIYLFIDNEPALQSADGSIVASATASAATTTGGTGTWSIDLRNFAIKTGETLTVKAKAPGGPSTTNPYKGLSANSAGVAMGANCTTPAPTITSTTPCPTVTNITGTFASGATVLSGTTVTVYRQTGSTPDLTKDTRITEVATVTGTTWTAPLLGNANLAPGNTLYAVATGPAGRTTSSPSTATQVTSNSPASSYGLVLTSPIKERATVITGTSTTNGTVNLYIDGQRIAGTATVTGASTSTPVTWSIAISSVNQANLGTGTTVTASISPATAPAGGNTCESLQTSAVLVSCVPPSTTPTLAPAAQTVCNNSAAVLTVNNSENGVIYQIYNGTEASGPAMVGNGGSITLLSANLTAATVLTVRAFQVGAPDCQATLNGSTAITIAPPPTAFAISPLSASVCNGASASVTLAGSEEDVTYQIQLLNAATGTYTNTGNAVPGTGGALTMTTSTLTASGTFRVVGIRNGCTTEMGNTFAVTVPSSALTIVPSVQSVCAGSTATVTIQNSGNGISYQLQRFDGSNYVNSGSPVTGSGTSISLTTAALSVAGANTFRVWATSGQCAPFALTQQVTVNVTSGPPTAFTVTPATLSVCSGQVATLSLSGSQVGVSYQLYSGSTPVGSIVQGTGNALTLSSGAITTGGTYTVRATNSCGTQVTMGNTAVTVNPIPTAFALTPTTQSLCNNTAASIVVSGSQTNVTYRIQVYDPATGTYNDSGTGITGTGSAITLTSGLLTTSANLKVVATNSNGCSADMSNRVFVAVPTSSLTVAAITPTVCAGSPGQVRVVASETEVFYQLYVGSTAVGTSVEGTGGDIILTSSAITSTTSFTVRATPSNPAGCTAFQVGSPVTVNVSAPINQPTTLASATAVCSGSTGSITLATSQQGITYQMYNGTVPTGFGVTGTGGAITLTSDALSSNANLQVFAISSGCSNTPMGAAYPITVTTLPTQYSFENTQKIISSGGTVTIELLTTQNGVDYQIYNGSTPTGNRVRGNGTGIVLTSGPLSSPATLTVQALGTGGCSNITMRGFSAVTIDAAPLPVTLTSFTAIATGNGVQLDWTTASEKDNDYFFVERSHNGKEFVQLNQVKGNGTSTVTQTYTFTDAAAPAGTVYYRLKQVDVDGNSEYSKVISVQTSGSKAGAQVTVAPNPFIKDLTVTVNSAEDRTVILELYDVNQKLIIKETAQVSAGKATITKDLSTVANGIYFLRVTGASLSEVIRVVKKD
ncbi:beta strand repeat-containing protein [Rufibacter sediminis]|uniref:T9SS type A sorting domain-containing protein n=1 Tax=Rufibacter sediminis TaxID=2762756 RepID=A0ABR6VYD2_9BACT|nr:T9SS type A sorting domain-containing protein [Rufibacter sediminis]MBC3542215.1 T9SS type A sorting domain-containing protein [Rufibacter sediminis]